MRAALPGGPRYTISSLAVVAQTLQDAEDGLLPTPRVGGGNRNSRAALTGANAERYGRTPRGAASGLGLEQALELASGQVPRELLPTPRVSGGSSTTAPSPSTLNGRHGDDLGPAVAGLLPTPVAADGDRASTVYVRGNPTLLGALLPTPGATDFKGDGNPGDREPRPSGRERTEGDNDLPAAVAGLLPTPSATLGSNAGLVTDAKGREGGTLVEAISLLKTPTAQLAVNGGSQHPDKRRAGGHGPTLADEVENLPEEDLLPTPNATHRRRESLTGPLLDGVVDDLLPSPSASDGVGGHHSRGGERGGELLLPGLAISVAAEPEVDWGKYAAAVRRWQRVFGRAAPYPLAVGRSGNRTLSPVFVEWMMGLPEGHVTGVPRLSRSAKLKLLGNGVVPQQALYGMHVILSRLAAERDEAA